MAEKLAGRSLHVSVVMIPGARGKQTKYIRSFNNDEIPVKGRIPTKPFVFEMDLPGNVVQCCFTGTVSGIMKRKFDVLGQTCARCRNGDKFGSILASSEQFGECLEENERPSGIDLKAMLILQCNLRMAQK
jgi:hypothetical protein